MLEKTAKNSEARVAEVAETLNIELPKSKAPLVMKLITLFTLIGGLSIIGSLFVDIGRPSASIQSKFYILRLIIGMLAIGTAYGLAKKERWAMWLYGIIAVAGFYLNPITVLIPGTAFAYLYAKRDRLRVSAFDMWIMNTAA